MQNIPELIVRIANLAEAEGRVLRSMTVRVAMAVSIVLVAAGALTSGVVLLLASVYLAIAACAGSAAGAAATGALALTLGGILIWLGHRMAN